MTSGWKTIPAILVAAGTIGFAGTLAVLFWFDPSRYGFYPVCLFHQLTGLLCPGCGSLRALHQLLHGRLTAAFYFNPLLVLALPLGLLWAAAFGWWRFRHQPAPILIRTRWAWLLAAIAIALSIWRNLPGSPFALPGVF